MEPTQRDFDRIPGENLRVPRAEFVAVWTLAEQLAADDWYAVGVAVTCEWLACSFPPSLPHLGGRPEPARAPVTRTRRQAHPELIEIEAVRIAGYTASHPNGMPGRPGFLEGASATMEWVWRGVGGPPLDIGATATG